ncbi:MAG: LysR family transcriptional regulator [Pseudomonadota bacterium]
MLELRDLQFLSALARHRHFAKAAAACGVSQPAFSMRIRAMEDRLDTAIVNRGNRFQGLTPEGEAILRHAKPILEEMRALEQDILAAKGTVSGSLTFTVIPTAAAFAARLSIQLHAAYPGIVARVTTASSLEIQQGIEEGTVDAGLSYSDTVVSEMIDAHPLYEEVYYLLAPDHLLAADTKTMAWAATTDLPLSLLEPKMQNRVIIDRIFADLDVTPDIVAEAGAMSICVSMACEGLAATVVPGILIESLGPLEGTVAVPLVAPEVTKSISLLTPARAHGLPTVEALKDIAISS